MKRLLTILGLGLGVLLQGCYQPVFAQTSNYGGVSINGSYTTNCIPYAVTSVTLNCSDLVDSAGVSITSTVPLILADSSSGALLTIRRSGAANTGFYMTSTSTGLVNQTSGWLTISNTAQAGVQVPAAGGYGISSSANIAAIGSDVFLGRVGAANWQFGKAANASPVSYIVNFGESSRAATDTDVAGANGTVRPGTGTGIGAGTKFCIQRNLMGATGSAAQSTVDGYCVGPSKTLSNTTATATSLVNISVPSNSAGGVEGTITITCTDGTNFDSETQSFNTSYVNKATVLTVTAPVITATSAANNSGSCTAGITAVAGTNSVDIKVTPAFTTIVPTTVTSYIAIRNNGTGNATFN